MFNLIDLGRRKVREIFGDDIHNGNFRGKDKDSGISGSRFQVSCFRFQFRFRVSGYATPIVNILFYVVLKIISWIYIFATRQRYNLFYAKIDLYLDIGSGNSFGFPADRSGFPPGVY